jgi:hypothetical protein
MDLKKIITSLFGKKNETQPTQIYSHESNEKINAYRELEDNKMEEFRIKELEDNIRASFEAVDFTVSYMENKIQNIACGLAIHKKLSYSQTSNIFEKGIQICGKAPVNPFKFVKVIKYYYDNFYSDEKQEEYYNHNETVKEKYANLEKELDEKYKKH